jgi:hypothetical protein
MTDFYYKMKEVLLKDPTLSRELKEVFFSDALREQILQCDSISMIDFLQKIIVGAADLSHNMMEGITFTTNFKENDQYYVIILQKLEEEIVLLKQQQIQDEFIIDSFESKNRKSCKIIIKELLRNQHKQHNRSNKIIINC